MPKTIRNQYDKKLTYESLMKAHIESRKGKNIRKEIILFNLKQEEYIMWLYEQLKNGTYKHSRYATFYVTEPKLRLIEKSAYIDRIVHRWYVDNFMKEYFIKSFINTSYACLENRGMHKACINVQNTMKHCKRIWNNYYIIKMDIAKYFQNIDKSILYNILQRKIKDKNIKNNNSYIYHTPFNQSNLYCQTFNDMSIDNMETILLLLHQSCSITTLFKKSKRRAEHHNKRFMQEL